MILCTISLAVQCRTCDLRAVGSNPAGGTLFLPLFPFFAHCKFGHLYVQASVEGIMFHKHQF